MTDDRWAEIARDVAVARPVSLTEAAAVLARQMSDVEKSFRMLTRSIEIAASFWPRRRPDPFASRRVASLRRGSVI